MTTELHYNGNVYELTGNVSARELLDDVGTTIRSGGGTVKAETTRGQLTLIVGETIPLAVLEIE